MNNLLNNVSAAAIELIASIGPVGVRTNPDLTKKSVEISTFHIPTTTEIAIEIVLFPIEEIIYWFDGDQHPESEWSHLIDRWHGKNKAE
jgi:hypothetical protein